MRKSVLAVSALATTAVVVYMSLAGIVRARHGRLGVPRVEYQPAIDLGEREIGEQVDVPIEIVNRGTGDLRVSDVRTNCSCSSLERIHEDRRLRVTSLELAPGEVARLRMRVVVRGTPGGPLENVLAFRTNDPKGPDGRIDISVRRVLGGIMAVPNGCYFGTVPIGKDVRRVLDIRDLAVRPRKIQGVESSEPDAVAVRLLPADAHAPADEAGASGVLVGRVEVSVNARRPGDVAPKVRLRLSGGARNPDEIPVVGRVSQPVEAMPPSLVLPRSSETGPVFEAACVCRSAGGRPFTLEVDSAPRGLAVKVTGAALDGPARVVHVAWDREGGRDLAGSGPHVVRLRATVDGQVSQFDLPVVCREAQP